VSDRAATKDSLGAMEVNTDRPPALQGSDSSS
jgi:hypothetical protein